MSDGGCLCGAVTLAFDGPPITARQCWCRDCQYVAGGGATNNAFFRSEQVTWEGEVRWHDSPAASGTMLSRGFCPACGTPLFSQSHARRHLIVVRMGAIDDPALVAPAQVIWTSSAPPWACLDPALPHVERQPPPAG